MAGASLPEYKQHTILFKTVGAGGGAGCRALWKWREEVPGTRAGQQMTLFLGHLGSLRLAKSTLLLSSPDKGIQTLQKQITTKSKKPPYPKTKAKALKNKTTRKQNNCCFVSSGLSAQDRKHSMPTAQHSGPSCAPSQPTPLLPFLGSGRSLTQPSTTDRDWTFGLVKPRRQLSGLRLPMLSVQP